MSVAIPMNSVPRRLTASIGSIPCAPLVCSQTVAPAAPDVAWPATRRRWAVGDGRLRREVAGRVGRRSGDGAGRDGEQQRDDADADSDLCADRQLGRAALHGIRDTSSSTTPSAKVNCALNVQTPLGGHVGGVRM